MSPIAPFSTRGVGCDSRVRVLAVCLERGSRSTWLLCSAEQMRDDCGEMGYL